jgi:gamma-glutamylcyclotransferase (GGCT)/AIG2-like uncharacterized protein YtfP
MNDTKSYNPCRFNDSRDDSFDLIKQHHHLTLFVYGTLKRDFWNHDRFCRNTIDIKPATTWGRLYDLPAGYPALEVPESAILAHGTADPLADAATQARIADEIANMPDQPRPLGDWDLIHGELVTFADPARDLPSIDRLEGFHPGQPSLYQRVILPVFLGHEVQLCWSYIMPGCSKRHRIRTGSWHPGIRST